MSEQSRAAAGLSHVETATLWATALWARYRPVVAVAGVIVAAAQVVPWAVAGGWPFHDSIAFWQAGRHVLEGVNPYAGDPVFLAFRYAPPWAVALAPLSLLDPYVFTTLLLVGQLAALRWLAGSWTTFGLWGWLPFVPRELATGNVDIIMAAAIYAGVARMRGGSGVGGVVRVRELLTRARGHPLAGGGHLRSRLPGGDAAGGLPVADVGGVAAAHASARHLDPAVAPATGRGWTASRPTAVGHRRGRGDRHTRVLLPQSRAAPARVAPLVTGAPRP